VTLALSLVAVAAIGAGALLAAWRARAPIARFQGRPGKSANYRTWAPFFLDDETLALVREDETGLAGEIPVAHLTIEVRSLPTGRTLRATTVDGVVLGSSPRREDVPVWIGEDLVRVHSLEPVELELWSPRSGEVGRRLRLGERGRRVALSRSGQIAAVASFASSNETSWYQTIEIRSSGNGAVLKTLRLPDGTNVVDDLFFAAREDRLLACVRAGLGLPHEEVFVFSLEDGKRVADLDLTRLELIGPRPVLDDRDELLSAREEERGTLPRLRSFSLDGTLLREVPLDDGRPGTPRVLALYDTVDPERFVCVLSDIDAPRWWGVGVFDGRAGRFLVRVPFDESLVPEADRKGPLPVRCALSSSGERLAVVSWRGEVSVYRVPP
jgi:hypothetical protein